MENDIHISKKAVIGSNVQILTGAIIGDDVIVGDNAIIGRYSVLKPGTVIGDDVFIDDYVISSGQNEIGDGSKIRYQSIIARNVVIGQNVFFCAGVKTAYLTHSREESIRKLRISDNCFLGDNVTVMSEVKLAEGVVIGANSLVTKHCDMPYCVYFGTPAKYIRQLSKEERELAKQRE